MDALEKLSFLGDFMSFEPDMEFCSKQPQKSPSTQDNRVPYQPELVRRTCREAPPDYQVGAVQKASDLVVFQAALPNGKRISLLKTLLTSACERDCYYCAFRRGRDIPRVTFKPDEMAQAFMKLSTARKVEGLFLSSGIAGGGVATQDRLIKTAEILRVKLGYRGYLHLKIMPGAERAQVERMMQLADRVSVNLEAPNTTRLAQLAPHKTFLEELLDPLGWVEEIRRSQPPWRGWNQRWPSSCTQFVVGGADENDLELLTTTERLFQQYHLRRTYFSGFKPLVNTPLEDRPPLNPWRQHRLYQASFLLRDYGFDIEDLPFSNQGHLPLQEDPKLAWANQHLSWQPVEINQADRHELLRIPGIGPKAAQAILEARQKGKLRRLSDLRCLGIQVNRAAPFLLLDGKQFLRQMNFF